MHLAPALIILRSFRIFHLWQNPSLCAPEPASSHFAPFSSNRIAHFQVPTVPNSTSAAIICPPCLSWLYLAFPSSFPHPHSIFQLISIPIFSLHTQGTTDSPVVRRLFPVLSGSCLLCSQGSHCSRGVPKSSWKNKMLNCKKKEQHRVFC